jgi:hypothetical protein
LLAAPGARGDYVGLDVEIDTFALDGVTPLFALGFYGLRVYNVYAAFDDPQDQCTGVVGLPGSPFSVATCDGAGFANSPFGTDQPPTELAVQIEPDVHVDSFYTLGSRILGVPFEDELIVAPATPGPNTDPWPASPSQAMNMGWVCRPTLPNGITPTPQTVAGNWPGNRVLLMRLVVPEGASVQGEFTLLVFLEGAGSLVTDSFFVDDAAAYGGCCAGGSECVDCSTAEECAMMGGEFLGSGVACPVQEILVEFMEGSGVFNYVMQVPADSCDGGGGGAADTGGAAGAGGTECVSGPLIDPWISPEHPLMCYSFGVPGSPAIPAGFFGPGSLPFSGPVCLRGVPLGVIEIDGMEADFGAADTLIRRSADPFDGCSIPDSYPSGPAAVDLEVAALSLESVQPITVAFQAPGPPPQSWHVAVDLSSVYPDEDPSNDPPLGSLSAVRTWSNGGTYASVLFVQMRFTFTRVDDPSDVRVLDTGLEGIDPVVVATETPVPWVHRVNPGLRVPAPFCTHFHPGIAGPDAFFQDCNGNQIRDDCDIDQGTSADEDGNGIPDECEPAAPCPPDQDGDGDVDVNDLVALVTAWGPCEGFCPADLTFDGEVDPEDLAAVLNAWGPCPP